MMRMLTIVAALAASTMLGGWGFARAGAGGYCAPNPRFVSEVPPPRHRKYR